MSPSTSLVCTSCRAALVPGESRCSHCGAPVTGVGGSGPPSGPPGGGIGPGFSWDAVLHHLRELTLGEYEILTELGRGGMAAVYLAHEHALNRKVALKVMSPAIMLTEGMVERFSAEAIMQANLTHANIVGVHAVRRDQELHYFAMQYVPGRSLQQVLRSELDAGRPLPVDVIRSLLYQVGSALAYAHRRGVIHRDIKPANVLLNADGDAVVTDFGIAKVAASPSQTMTGTVVGTAPYMSPEQCYAAELTGASDQYSLGILAYELLTGSPPFVGNSFIVMQAHTLETPAPVSSKRPDCPPELEASVMRMLAKHREDRFPDVNAALVALEARPASSHTDDPVRATLVRLADVAGVESALADVLRVPLSPMPRSRRPRTPIPAGSPAIQTPPAGHRATEPARVVMLRLSDPPSRIESGEVLRLEASTTDTRGAPLAGIPLRWSSTNPKIARVAPETGEIEALAPGSADIVVSCENAVATVRLVVREAEVARVTVGGLPEVLETGDRVTVRAEAYDARGTLLERPVKWSMPDSTVASVTTDGRVSARAPGSVALTVTVGAVSTTHQVVVRAPRVTEITLAGWPEILGIGETARLTATLRDKSGNALPARALAWASSDPDVVRVSNGVVEGMGEGEAVIEARADDAHATALVPVGVVPIARLEVTDIPERAKEGWRKRVEVTASDARGKVREIPAVWTSSAPLIAAVDDRGNVMALSPGTATLRVRCGTMERSFPLEVRENIALSQRALLAWSQVPRPRVPKRALTALAAIAVVGAGAFAIVRLAGSGSTTTKDAVTQTTVDRVAIANLPTQEFRVGQSIRLDARVLDAVGNLLGRPVEWSVAPDTLASIDANGTLSATGEGRVMVVASAGGVRDSAVVMIAAVPRPPEPAPAGDTVTTLGITNIAATMTVNDAARPRLSATRGGRPVTPPASVQWRSSNASVVRVDAAGHVTAVGPGAAIITASTTAGSARMNVVVNRPAAAVVNRPPDVVRPAAVAGVSISGLPPRDFREGQTVQLGARVVDAAGNALSGRTVEWTVTPSSRASIDANGVLRATAEGRVTVVAASEGVRDSAVVLIAALSRAPDPLPPPDSSAGRTGGRATPAGGSTGGAAAVPLRAADVTEGANVVVRAIISRDTSRVRGIYSTAAEDAGRFSALARAMRGAASIVTVGGARDPDPTSAGDRSTVAIRRTFEFRFPALRPRALLELELTFARDANAWRLQSFRILNNPSYR